MGFTLEIGAKVPEFKLKGVDGKLHSPADYVDKKALVVIVSCNHCPTVVEYEDRMVEISRDYAAKGVQFIVINGNQPGPHGIGPVLWFGNFTRNGNHRLFSLRPFGPAFGIYQNIHQFRQM